jgi:uncharacterized protein (DUF433 family)
MYWIPFVGNMAFSFPRCALPWNFSGNTIAQNILWPKKISRRMACVSLFVEKYGSLIDASKSGQVAMPEILSIYLQRIERDDTGLPIRLFPFTRKGDLHHPRVIVIDPRIGFGRPTVAGTNIAAAIVAERCHAGESVQELAIDYGRSPQEIEEAIRCEPRREAA